MPRPARSESSKLFARAKRVLPGGVDSPVRAFGAVGGEPPFIERARAARIQDFDGRTYIDYVMSWGPLIHGHAPPGLTRALRSAPRLVELADWSAASSRRSSESGSSIPAPRRR